MRKLNRQNVKFTQSKALQVGTLLAIILIARLCYWSEPFGISVDESTYIALSEVTANGGTLYVDAVDRKPPAHIALYRLIGEISNPWNIHAVHIVFIFLVLLLCLAAGSFLTNAKEKLWAAFLFAIFSSCLPREILSANAEIPMTLLLAAAILVLIRNIERPKIEFVFWATMLAGISTLFKQYGGIIFAAAYFAWMNACYTKSKNYWKIQIRAALAAVGALAIVYSSVSLYFVSKNAFNEFLYYSLFDGIKFVAESRTIKNNDTSFVIAILGILISWPFLWWGFVKAMQKKISKVDSILVAALFGSFLTAILSGRYYTHYFLPVIFFLCPIAATSAPRLFSKFPKLVILSIALPFAIFAYTNFDRDQLKEWSFSKNRQQQLSEVGKWVREHSMQADRIVVWGMASQLYPLSERGSGTRFVFSDFVSGRQPGFKSTESLPILGADKEFIADLEKNRPLFIIDTSGAKLNDYGAFPLSRFPLIDSYIQGHYSVVENLSGFQILKRN